MVWLCVLGPHGRSGWGRGAGDQHRKCVLWTFCSSRLGRPLVTRDPSSSLTFSVARTSQEFGGRGSLTFSVACTSQELGVRWGAEGLESCISPPCLVSESPSRAGAVRSRGPTWPALPLASRECDPFPKPRVSAPRAQALTDVLGSDSHWPSELGDKLFVVQADLNDVVQEREERGQREGCDKQGDEAELDDCREGRRSARAAPGSGRRDPRPGPDGTLPPACKRASRHGPCSPG